MFSTLTDQNEILYISQTLILKKPFLNTFPKSKKNTFVLIQYTGRYNTDQHKPATQNAGHH